MEQSHINFLVFTSAFLLCFTTVVSLECYACENQQGNKDKCIKTTKQCEEHQDICKTEIQWGLPPYWVPYGDRVHSVSKNCDTKSRCYAEENKMMRHCKRDWFDDWGCVECCTGDLCNFYVTLGAGNVRSSFIFILASLLTTFFLRWML